MDIKDVEKIERTRGVAFTVKADDIKDAYTERVAKFLRDYQTPMGDDWVRSVANKLYRFQGKNNEGDLLGSSTDMGVALATFCPEVPLITGKQLLDLYKSVGDKNPFGQVYIDFGVQINGKPNINPVQARILLQDFKKRGIKVGEGRVPDFNQLKLRADKEAGLVYSLAEGVSAGDIAVVSDYPFKGRVGKNGVFRAYLGRGGGWCADFDGLPDSIDSGGVVSYNAEGVAPKKLIRNTPKPDLVEILTTDFMEKF